MIEKGNCSSALLDSLMNHNHHAERPSVTPKEKPIQPTIANEADP